jgi:ferredoxin
LTKIYYFSGTGNTLWSARKLAELLGGDCTLHNIGAEAYADTLVIEAGAVVLLFPSYAYGAPAVVRRFVKRAVFNTPYVAVFVTFGSSPGGTLGGIRRLLKRKYAGASFWGRIPSVENYIPIFGPQKPETIDKRLVLQRDATEEAARLVAARAVNRVCTFRPLSSFVSLLFSLAVPLFYTRYRLSGDCSGCGLCEKLCPVSAIVMRDGRPRFSGRCEHCLGCLNWCPRSAIHFGRLGPGTPRYHHPEIGPADMARSAPLSP